MTARMLAAGLLLAVGVAHAQVTPQSAAVAASAVAAAKSASAAASASDAAEPVKPLVDNPLFTGMSPEVRAKGEALGKEIISNIMSSYEERIKDPKVLAESRRQRQYVDSIANETIQADRDKVLEFLGIDPDAPTGLYVFVSYSMPLDMLRAYVLDAMWSGATVVFRGFPDNRTLGDFITKDLKDLVYGRSAAANISLDPRLFDAYQVTVVPTIVFSRVRTDMLCRGMNPVAFKYQNETLSYDTCPPLKDTDYYKVSGAVSMNYALETFKDAGAVEAGSYLRALAKGFASGIPPAKSQLPFAGKWESVLSPEETARVRELAKTQGFTQQKANAGVRDEPVTNQGTNAPPRVAPATTETR